MGKASLAGRARSVLAILAAVIVVALGAFPSPAMAAQRDAQTPAPDERSIMIGKNEPVILSADDSDEHIRVLAKVDTGANIPSIDDDLARRLGIDLKNPPDTVTIKSATGEEERPLVPVKVQIAGETREVQATVTDREGLSTQMLLGQDVLGGFTITTDREQLTQPGSPQADSSIVSLLDFPPPPPGAPTLLATLPLAAAVIVLLRTVVGLQTFGMFAPVLLAIAFVQTGLPAGLLMFLVMMGVGTLAQPLLAPLRLPRLARLAVLLAISAAMLLGAQFFINNPAVTATWAAAFPVVVISVTIERFWEQWEQEGLWPGLQVSFATMVVAVIATPALVADPVAWVARNYPAALSVAGAALSVAFGSYRGLRLLEYARFRPALGGAKK